MSLFVLASKDGWVNIMYNGLDAVAVDQQVGITGATGMKMVGSKETVSHRGSWSPRTNLVPSGLRGS